MANRHRRCSESSPMSLPEVRSATLWEKGFAFTTTIATIGMLVAAVLQLLAIYNFRQELAYSEQVNHIRDLYIGEYIDRRFLNPVVIEGETYATLKEVRRIVQKRLDGKSLDEQRRILNEFREATLRQNTWENAFAYQLTLAQERVGELVLSGVLPLETILSMNGYQILEDWAYSSRLIEAEIQKPEDPVSVRGSVPFKRRHAEWLACIAALYTTKHWRSQRLSLFIDYIGARATILEKELNIRQLDGFSISSRTAGRIDSLRRIE